MNETILEKQITQPLFILIENNLDTQITINQSDNEKEKSNLFIIIYRVKSQ